MRVDPDSLRSGKNAVVFSTAFCVRDSIKRSIHSPAVYRLALALAALFVAIRCSTPAAAPAGPAGVYERAKQSFAKGQTESYDKALDSLDTLTNADPPNDYTVRARVLRAVILSGQMEGYKTLFEAYGKGAETTKNTDNRAEYTGLHRDTLRRGAELALGLGEVTMQLTKGGTIAKQLSLEAPYPSSEPGDSIPALDRVKQGLKTGRTDQEDAAIEAPRIGVADALAQVVGGDRAKAKSQLSAGPVTLNGADFALFLGEEVATGASLYDKKHINDAGRFKVLTDIANGAAQAAGAALKDSPDPDRAKRLKKLQDRIKAAIKAQA
jgi:hypothetical protein